jgi:predicted PurR-regulated permease PerM
MLLEASSLPQKVKTAYGVDSEIVGQSRKLLAAVKQYIVTKSLLSLITAALIAVWLWLLGVDYVLLWALLAFLLNFVPNIGSIIAAVPAVLIAGLDLGPTFAGLAAVGYLAVNMLVGNILEPRIMGRDMGLSPLVVYLSLIFWGWLLGPVGMLLSVPLSMAVKLMLETMPSGRRLAIILGDDPLASDQPTQQSGS